MTESIFVPFKLTEKEAIEKAMDVLTGETAPKVVSDQFYTLATAEEEAAFDERMRQRYLTRKSN